MRRTDRVKILSLDTATENCSAALLIDGVVREREVELERGHAERVLPMVDELLAEAGITLKALDAIAFGRGPGSFTGVRMAATVTQGLAFGADLGVVPVSDLRAVAQRALGLDALINRVVVCNDARMSEVYWACFERGTLARAPDAPGFAQLEGEERVSKPSAVTVPQNWSTATAVGRGFAAYADALRHAVPTVSADRHELLSLLPRASEIAILAVPDVVAGRLVPPEQAIPVYLRDNVVHGAQPPAPPKRA